MTRFTEETIMIGNWVELTEDEILRLEIELIELGRILDTNKLDYDSSGNLIVVYCSTSPLIDSFTTLIIKNFNYSFTISSY